VSFFPTCRTYRTCQSACQQNIVLLVMCGTSPWVFLCNFECVYPWFCNDFECLLCLSCHLLRFRFRAWPVAAPHLSLLNSITLGSFDTCHGGQSFALQIARIQCNHVSVACFGWRRFQLLSLDVVEPSASKHHGCI
jgi:hypothetical protein